MNTGVLYDTVRYYAILAETNSMLCQQSSDPDIIGYKVSQSSRRDLNPEVGAKGLNKGCVRQKSHHETTVHH
jgi:hypothetical protein